MGFRRKNNLEPTHQKSSELLQKGLKMQNPSQDLKKQLARFRSHELPSHPVFFQKQKKLLALESQIIMRRAAAAPESITRQSLSNYSSRQKQKTTLHQRMELSGRELRGPQSHTHTHANGRTHTHANSRTHPHYTHTGSHATSKLLQLGVLQERFNQIIFCNTTKASEMSKK